MTGDELHAAAVALVERTTKAQGLPYHVEDPATLQRIARLLLRGLDHPAGNAR